MKIYIPELVKTRLSLNKVVKIAWLTPHFLAYKTVQLGD